MRRFFATFLVLAAGARVVVAAIPDTDAAWTNLPAARPPAPASTASSAKPAPKPATHVSATPNAAELQAALAQLKQTNQELLDLLKKQQAVLEDVQFDRRLQSRQIASLEERLEQALSDKRDLDKKVSDLELQAATQPTAAARDYKEPDVETVPQSGTIHGKSFTPSTDNASAAGTSTITMPTVETVKPDSTAPPPPADDTPKSYLPPAAPEDPSGAAMWHRLLTLKGADSQQTGVFTVHGRNWRVVWHNQDKPGKLSANTSGLFIDAFPKDDTIPQHVCEKMGTGGDTMQLQGPGNYYLKIDASGGSWELAVEDYH